MTDLETVLIKLDDRDKRIFGKMDDHHKEVTDELKSNTAQIHEALLQIAKKPCGVHAERMDSMRAQIKRMWVLVGGMVMGLIGLGFKALTGAPNQ